jgi:ribosome maturation factor RimP
MSSPSRDIEERVRALLEEPVEAEGFELVAVVHTTADGKRTLRVHIDKPGGVTVGDCTRVSRLVSPLLDVHDPIVGAYRLEVSSPGMDRPLQRPADFERFAGYRARLRLEKGTGTRQLSGVLRGFEEGCVLIERTEHIRRVPLEAIERAHLNLDLDEYRALAGLGDPNEQESPDDQ